MLGIKPTSTEQRKACAGQGLRLWGFIVMQSHGWAELGALPLRLRREQSWHCPLSLPAHHGTRSRSSVLSVPMAPPHQLAAHRSLTWRLQGLPKPSIRDRRSCGFSIKKLWNKMPLPKLIKYPSHHQASPGNGTKNRAGKFVSLVQLPGTLRIYLKCRTKSFAMHKESEITRVGKALHGKSLNKGSLIAFQWTDV